MSIRKVNEIFGYSAFAVGVLKLLLIILVLVQFGTSIFNGGSSNSEYFPTFSAIIGFAQIILIISSVIMIVLNRKKEPEVIKGYLYVLGAFLLEIITPPILSFYVAFVECSLYMKAGDRIINKNLSGNKNYKKIKQDIKNTEWFYSEK